MSDPDCCWLDQKQYYDHLESIGKNRLIKIANRWNIIIHKQKLNKFSLKDRCTGIRVRGRAKKNNILGNIK